MCALRLITAPQTPLPPRQDTSKNDPRKRLRRFFESLYACLSKGARAVLQVGVWEGHGSPLGAAVWACLAAQRAPAVIGLKCGFVLHAAPAGSSRSLTLYC